MVSTRSSLARRTPRLTPLVVVGLLALCPGLARADGQRPLVSLPTLQQGSAIRGMEVVTIVWKRADDGAPVRSVKVIVDGDEIAHFDVRPLDMTMLWNWDTTGYADGRHEIEVQVEDTRGRQRSYQTFLWIRNGLAPAPTPGDVRIEVEDLDGTSDGILTQRALVRVHIDETIGAKWVIIKINGRFFAMLNRLPIQTVLDPARMALDDGVHVVDVRVVHPDNTESSVSLPITINRNGTYTPLRPPATVPATTPAPAVPAVAGALRGERPGPAGARDLGRSTTRAPQPTLRSRGLSGDAPDLAVPAAAGTTAVRPALPELPLSAAGPARPVATPRGNRPSPADKPTGPAAEPVRAGIVVPAHLRGTAPSAPPPAASAAPRPAQPRHAPEPALATTPGQAPAAAGPLDGASAPLPGLPATPAPRATASATAPAVAPAAPAATAPAEALGPRLAPPTRLATPPTQAPGIDRGPRGSVPSGPRAALAGTARGVGRVHTVQTGETLSAIARRYRVDLRELTRLNRLTDPHHIVRGQRLVLPGHFGRMSVNGAPVRTDVTPWQVRSGIDTTPFRFVVEALGGTVSWMGPERMVTAQTPDRGVITITVGSREAQVNDETVLMDLAAYLQDGRTFVPMRFVSDTLDVTVDVDPDSGDISITSNR